MRILMALSLLIPVFSHAMGDGEGERNKEDSFIPMLPSKKKSRTTTHPLLNNDYDEENPNLVEQRYTTASKQQSKRGRGPQGFEELDLASIAIQPPVFTQHPLVDHVRSQIGLAHVDSQIIKEAIDHADKYHKNLYNALINAHSSAQVEVQKKKITRLITRTENEDESKGGAPHTQQTIETFLEALVKYNDFKMKMKDEDHAQKQKAAQETIEENKKNARKKLFISIVTNGLTLVVTAVTTVLAIVYGTEDCDCSNGGGNSTTSSVENNEQFARNATQLFGAVKWWGA